jgi:hypothetical protein
MQAALERCAPEGGDARASAALSTMVGAVVLARLTDSPGEADAILAAARQAVLGGR